jgi:hypothetical protein
LFTLTEEVKNSRKELWSDPNAGILHSQHHLIISLLLGAQPDTATLVRVLGSVAK